MKTRILASLLIAAILYILFQFVNSKKAFEDTSSRIEKLYKENESLKDSVKQHLIKLSDYQYFSIEDNGEAKDYFYNLDIENINKYVSDKLIQTNLQKGDNPLISYSGQGSGFKINKIRVLNHKWIICDFSDGKLWGELFLAYYINEDKSVEFSPISEFLYPQQ